MTIVRPSHTYDKTSVPFHGGWTVVDRMRQGKPVLADQSAFQQIDAIVSRTAPGEALDLLDTYWSMGDLPALCASLNRAGLGIVETRTRIGTVRYGTVENFVETEIKGTPLADRLSQSQIESILTESAEILNSFVTPQRGLEMPITSHLVAARRKWIVSAQ